jgi:hypothetical protein
MRRKKERKGGDYTALKAATSVPRRNTDTVVPASPLAAGMKCGGRVQKKAKGGRVHGCGLSRRKR